MQEMQVRSLGLEDPLEAGIATHSIIFAWRILDRGTWQSIVHRVAKSQTRPKKFSTHPHTIANPRLGVFFFVCFLNNLSCMAAGSAFSVHNMIDWQRPINGK